jgi:signal peptide peptidase SppA
MLKRGENLMGIINLVNNFSNAIWNIVPESLDTFINVLNNKNLMNSNINLLIDQSKDKKFNPSLTYQEIGSLGIISLSGVLMKKASFLDSMCGFISYDAVSEILEETTADNIAYLIDSPGGMSVGCKLLADQIYSLKNIKYQVAFVTGQMCSAALYLGAACDQIFSESPLNMVGSVGCVTCHVDQSSLDSKEGLKYTYISSGKYKTLGNEHEPLSKESNEIIQKRVNKNAEQFISDVSQYRGIVDSSTFKNAEVFNSLEAIDIGLIDDIKSFRQFLKENNL